MVLCSILFGITIYIPERDLGVSLMNCPESDEIREFFLYEKKKLFQWNSLELASNLYITFTSLYVLFESHTFKWHFQTFHFIIAYCASLSFSGLIY